MKASTVIIVTPETYEDHMLIQSLDPKPEKFSNIALESVGEQGHIWDRYSYTFAMDSDFVKRCIYESDKFGIITSTAKTLNDLLSNASQQLTEQ